MMRRTLLQPVFLLLVGFYFLVFFAGYQLFPVVPLHLRGMGAGLGESGRFMSAFTVGSATGALVTGPLGDRLGQRRVLRLATVALVGFLLAYAFMPVRWGFYLLAPLHGFVWSGLRTASVAKAGALLGAEERGEGMSFFGLAAPLGLAVGPAVGLALWPVLGFVKLMLVLAGVFLVCWAAIGRLPRDARDRGPGAGAAPAWSAVLPAALFIFLVGITFGPIPPYSAQEAHDLHLGWPAALLTSLSLGMVGLRLILVVRGLGRSPIRMLAPMVWLGAAGLAILALAPGGALRHAAGGLLYGAGYGMVHTLILMHVINRAGRNAGGAGVGAVYFSYDTGQALGSLGIGWAMEALAGRYGLAWGYRGGWALAALAMAGCLAFVPAIVRREEGR